MYFSACSTDAAEALKAMYTNIRQFINCCEPMEIALLPVVTNLIAVGLGPKNLMAIPCFLTKEEVKHRGPAYHADVAIKKMMSEQSSYVRVSKGGSEVVIVIELKTNVPGLIGSVPLKDILELFVYLIYIMDDNNQTTICGILSDTISWHCFNVILTVDGRLQILDYIRYYTEDEVAVLGFLQSLVEELKLC